MTMTGRRSTPPARMRLSVAELAAEVLMEDPGLLPAFVATAVAVDAHATALKMTLRRFHTLEVRLGRVMKQLGAQSDHFQPTEQEFAELLDYLGDSDVRERVEELQEAWPP
jgi:hypothetical protein